jgi:hypothetical protein
VDNGPGYNCICPEGYRGKHCDEDIVDCSPSSCPLAATCIDLTNDYYCKCPFNLTGEDCRKPINIDHDLFFNDETRQSSASLAVPFSIPGVSSLTAAFWVQFSSPDDAGTFFTLYRVGSAHLPVNKQQLIQAHSSGIHISLFPDAPDQHFTYLQQVPVNDGQWHHIAVIWDSNDGSLVLTTDSVIVDRRSGYGNQKTLTAHGWVTLGSPDMSVSPDIAGFHGRLSRVNVWSRPLNVLSDIPKQVRSCYRAPILFSSLLLRWTGYDRIKGTVERVSPGMCGKKICTPGYTEDCATLERDKTPPRVHYCPGDLRVIAANSSTVVTWEAPEFRDNVGVKNIQELHTVRSGQMFDRGNYEITYVAYDEAGNAAQCHFMVYVLKEFCPELPNPIGGGKRCADWGSGFKICSIYCDPNLRFSEPVPDFYSCGAEGFWRPTSNPAQPLTFPACSTANPAQRVFKIKLNFPTSVFCNDAGQGVLQSKIQAALVNLNKDWNLCSNQINDGGKCSGLRVNVDCKQKSRVRRQQSDSTDSDTGHYEVAISFPATSDPVRNINSNEKSTIQSLVEKIILESNHFDVGETLPNVVPDPSSLSLDDEFICPEGQVVVAPHCVDCAAGTFFARETKNCQPCPSGTYQNVVGKVSCKQCPRITGRPGVTKMPGARSSTMCKERCSAGMYYDEENSLCRVCGFGSYQPDEGQFSCLACGPGLTTRTDRALAQEECHEECASGLQLSAAGTCEPCPRGTYRTQSVDKTCNPCPEDKTTVSVGASFREECSLPICSAGMYLNATDSYTCVQCAKGTYQPDVQQTACIKCPQDTSTQQRGSTKVEQCTNPCEANEDGALCDVNARCLFDPDTDEHKCVCRHGYNETEEVQGKKGCIYKCNDYCMNDGICSIDDDSGEPVCECAGSFYGDQCIKKSEFAYIAGGIVGAALLVIFVLFIIAMICIRSQRRKEPKKLISQQPDAAGSQVNFYYGAPAPYAESIAPSHHSTYAHYYDDEEDGWEMPNFYNETYMKDSLANGKGSSLARSNASLYARHERPEDVYDRLNKHAYRPPAKKDAAGNDVISDSDDPH